MTKQPPPGGSSSTEPSVLRGRLPRVAAAVTQQLQVAVIPEARVGLTVMRLDVIAVQLLEHEATLLRTEGIARGGHIRERRATGGHDISSHESGVEGGPAPLPRAVVAA
jgi:hypothetical protein